MSAPATLPWFVEHATRRVRIVHGEPDDSGFRSDVPGIGRVGDIGHAPAVELAEFIVRACNAHEELVEALRAITDTLLVSSVCPFGLAYLKRSPIDKSFDTTCSCNFHEAARLAVAALAKAEGR